VDSKSRLKQFLRSTFRESSAPADPDTPVWERDDPRGPAPADAPVVRCVVDNRVFLLGLDERYREAMKKQERGQLLECAERVAAVLGQAPADVPVEGYYAEEPALTKYFRLMRGLQQVPLAREAEVEPLPEFQRLLAVSSSPIFGSPVREHLLPVGRDPLSAALYAVRMPQWSVPLLTAEAARLARESDDCSLVGLAARAEDPVVLAALRESVVLHAEVVVGCAMPLPRYEFVWQVAPEVAGAARRFVDAFNALFGRELPPPTAQFAELYWMTCRESNVVGRCVRIGQSNPPASYYHWAVRRNDAGELSVHEFWHDQVVTTEQYRNDLRRGIHPTGGAPQL
jgi:hypothetical protein